MLDALMFALGVILVGAAGIFVAIAGGITVGSFLSGGAQFPHYLLNKNDTTTMAFDAAISDTQTALKQMNRLKRKLNDHAIFINAEEARNDFR